MRRNNKRLKFSWIGCVGTLYPGTENLLHLEISIGPHWFLLFFPFAFSFSLFSVLVSLYLPLALISLPLVHWWRRYLIHRETSIQITNGHLRLGEAPPRPSCPIPYS